jgi:hypothetical protein
MTERRLLCLGARQPCPDLLRAPDDLHERCGVVGLRFLVVGT